MRQTGLSMSETVTENIPEYIFTILKCHIIIHVTAHAKHTFGTFELIEHCFHTQPV